MGTEILPPPNSLRLLSEPEVNSFYEIARRFVEQPDRCYNLALLNAATLMVVNPAPIPFVGISLNDTQELNTVQQWGVYHANRAQIPNQILLNKSTGEWWTAQRFLFPHLSYARPRHKIPISLTSLMTGALVLKGFREDTI